MSLFISETYVNKTKNARFGVEDIHEAPETSVEALYKALQAEYGRCTGRVHLELEGEGTLDVGWVFEKRMRYEDARTNTPSDHYTREVWVTVYEACPLDDPRALRRKTRLGEEVIGFTYKRLGEY